MNDETSRRPARSRAGRPVLTADTDIGRGPRRGVVCPGEGALRAERRGAAWRWGRLVTGRVEPSRGASLVAPRRDNIRFGAAVYGSFLVASVVGVAFEAGQDARFMTTTAFGSALVFWLAHWWSEVIGEQICGRRGVPTSRRARHRRASGRWSRRPSFPRSSSRSLGPACGRARRAPSSRSPRPFSRSWGGRWSPAVAPEDLAARRPLRRDPSNARYRAAASREGGSLRPKLGEAAAARSALETSSPRSVAHAHLGAPAREGVDAAPASGNVE